MTFEWENESIHYVDEGHGPALVLLHGLGGNLDNWLLQRYELSKTHRVLSLDLPGHGRSTGRKVHYADYWRVIEAMLDHAGVGSATFCGLSKGGRTGLAFAARRPARANGLVIINAFVRLDADDRAQRLDMYDLLLKQDGARLWADQLLPLMGVESYPAIVRGFRRSVDHIDPEHIRRIFREQDSCDQRPDLALVQCPVLVVQGAKDHLIPGYCAREIRDGLAHGELVVLDTGHLPYLEKPAEFNLTLLDFLGRHDI